MSYMISKVFTFSASHQLSGMPDGHPCARLHGHNYRVRVELTGPLDKRGMVFDYGALAPFAAWLDEMLDHRHLNELDMFARDNPTAENLARHCTAGLHAAVALPPIISAHVWVSETDKTWATWNPGA